jgi:CzcA family heavy metal efflux pump
MLDFIIRWSLTNRLLVLLAAFGLMGWSLVEARRLPVDVFPDLTAPTVTLVAEAHGMAPEELERLVTLPVESALNGANGLRRVRSSTGVGITVIWAEFQWGMDILEARQIVNEKLQSVAPELPSDLEMPQLAPITSIMGDILFIGIGPTKEDGASAMEIRSHAEWVVRRRLLAVPGVAQVIPTGGDVKQFQVQVDPARLAALKISMVEVIEAVQASNANTSAGFLQSGGMEYLIHGQGRVQNLNDLSDIVVASRDGHPIMIHDLADVVIGPALKRGEGAIGVHNGVVMGIKKQPNANTLDLTRRVEHALTDIKAGLPPGMRLHPNLFRQADFIEVAVENVTKALRDGAILVVLILAFFLVSGRATLISALAIPLSLGVAILVMRAFDLGINTMTLGGMAIAVGALVDDAIIDVENVLRRLRENTERPEGEKQSLTTVVFEASREVRASILFATLIIILVFVPLLFLTGVEGRLLAPLGFSYAVSLTASLLVALTVTPVLCLLLLPQSAAQNPEHDTFAIRHLKRLYRGVLTPALKRPREVGISAGVLFVISALFLSQGGTSFLPDFNEGALTISGVLPAGTSLHESNRLGQLVDQILNEDEAVIITARRTGRAERDEHAQSVNASEWEVRLKPDIDKKAVLARIRSKLQAVPGMQIVIGQPLSHRIDHMLSGTRANIAVKVFGHDRHALKRAAESVKAQMAQVDGVVDLAIEEPSDLPFIRVKVDRSALGLMGIHVDDVLHTMEAALVGQEVSKVLERDASYDLVVKLPDSIRDDLDSLRALPVRTHSGALIPLSSVTDIGRDRGPNTISREKVMRKMVIMCNVAGRDLGSVVDEIQTRVKKEVRLGAGMHVDYGGQFQSAQTARERLSTLSGLVAILVFFLLATALGSGRDAILVLVNLPLALIGGVAGVFLAGGVVSVASLIGFITLFGIATRNGLMMVTHFHHLADVEGETSPLALVQRGAMERLSPIVMTALASALGLVPLALKLGDPGSEIQAPMALVILCGLVSSTLLNLLVVPVLYLKFGEVCRRLRAP